jgi:bifunctional DNA-binding transcriptional regulator/antitoxin component of YhaV-PrlF toxin-antitoxin module
MRSRLSTKGRIVLAGPLRRKLGIRAGGPLDVAVEAGRTVSSPQYKEHRKPAIVDDPIAGLPVLSLRSDTPVLSSRDVQEIPSNSP